MSNYYTNNVHPPSGKEEIQQEEEGEIARGNVRGKARKRRQRGRGQRGRGWGQRRGGFMQGRGGRGRGGGQTRSYNSTVSLTNNNHYYVITIREQRQCIKISLLIVKTTIIIK